MLIIICISYKNCKLLGKNQEDHKTSNFNTFAMYTYACMSIHTYIVIRTPSVSGYNYTIYNA